MSGKTPSGPEGKVHVPVSCTRFVYIVQKFFSVSGVFCRSTHCRRILLNGAVFLSFEITDVGIGIRLLAGCTTGAMSVVFAQPTDVVKVRFQAQIHPSKSSVTKRYNGTIDAYKTIARVEGIKGLWKGTITILHPAMKMNF